MRGLIYKDLLTINSYKKSFVIVLLLFFVISSTNDSYSNFISFYIPFFIVMLSISTFSYDEHSKWDAYALTLPITRKDIVKSKYVFAFGMIIVGTIVGIILNMLLIYFQTKTIVFGEIIASFGGIDASMLLLVSIMFPLIYKFGAEKGRLFLFLVVGIGVTIIGSVSLILKNYFSNIDYSNVISFLNQYGWYIAVIVIMGLFYLSYNISSKIYLNKEF